MRALALTLACTGLIAGASLGGAPVLAAAPKKAAAKKPAAKKPVAAASAEETASGHAVLYLKVLINALQSDQVKEQAKTAMVGCLYGHSLGEITKAADEVFAKAPDKVHREKPAEVLVVLTNICGFEGDPTQTAPAGVPNGR